MIGKNGNTYVHEARDEPRMIEQRMTMGAMAALALRARDPKTGRESFGGHSSEC